MITYLNCKNILIVNDLIKLETGKFKVIGKNPFLEISNLPKGLIQEIYITLKDDCQALELYWTPGDNEPYSKAKSMIQKFNPHQKNCFSFEIDSNKELKKIGLKPLGTSKTFEIGRIDIKLSNPKIKKLDIEKVTKTSLKGKNKFLFLTNDTNNELKQHFDNSFKNNFNPDLFIKMLNFKEEYCGDRNIKYNFFIIPDKSLVCKEYLPFDVTCIKRNYDPLNVIVPDFADKLDHTDYFKNDSHINFIGGNELSYYYLNHIDRNFERDDFKQLTEDQLAPVDRLWECDLTMTKNWSYSEDEKKEYPNIMVPSFRNIYLKDISEKLPENFKWYGIRETEYFENPNAYKDLKVLIFRDSSLNTLKNTLSIYFKELLLYWDHWFFTPELIDWYKPDIILEIRTERFLENNFFKRII